MSTTLTPPRRPRTRDVLADYRRAVEVAAGGARALLRGVSWADYQACLREAGDGPVRMTYDKGLLEVEMPGEDHDSKKWTGGRFVEAYMDENDIDYAPKASTTWRREDVEAGLEADECYYIASYAKIRGIGRLIDLDLDPPPDLAIEIDLSPPKLHKAGVYARLRVPEIWRWRDGRLTVNLRQPDGTYAESDRSLALPGFPLDELAAELAIVPHGDESAHARAFRHRCRERAAG